MRKPKAHWSKVLKGLGACSRARRWAATQPSFPLAWRRCRVADWLRWIVSKQARFQRCYYSTCEPLNRCLPCRKRDVLWSSRYNTVKSIRARYARPDFEAIVTAYRIKQAKLKAEQAAGPFVSCRTAWRNA